MKKYKQNEIPVNPNLDREFCEKCVQICLHFHGNFSGFRFSSTDASLTMNFNLNTNIKQNIKW